jgi:predicted nucleic acid-binding protein
LIVVDASVLIEALLQGPGSPAASRLQSETGALAAPHLIDLEVMQVLRRTTAAGFVSRRRADEAVTDFLAFNIRRYSHRLLAPRIWALRDNLSAYDGAYVALAGLLDATLVTRDGRLSSAPGHGARVEVM